MPSKIAKDRTKLFIKKFGKDIAKAIQGTGLYFEAVVGQKCGESAYGTSSLATKSNNFGGIRNFGSLKGAIGTTASGYAIFQTPYDCFQSYVDTLKSPTKKYTSMGVFRATSPEEQIIKIVESGYAQTPPKAYLANCKSAIDATKEICPLGKIENLYASLDKMEKSII
jgi:flagellum-specific peptidoglycan hydrolase FlgJ